MKLVYSFFFILAALSLGCSSSGHGHDQESSSVTMENVSKLVPTPQAIEREPGATEAAPAIDLSSIAAAVTTDRAEFNATGGIYVFRLFAFQVIKTRSRHKDTVYATCAMTVDGRKYAPVTKKVGEFNDGKHLINLDLPAVAINPNSKVTYEYALINAGHGDPTKVQEALETGAGQALDQSGIGEPWLSIARIAIKIGSVLFFADCDGPLASYQVRLSGADIIQRAPLGQKPFTQYVYHPGTESAAGCRGNSKYDVTWAIIRIK